ncbi:MAG: hypothetical protein LBP76_11245, partial [Treponema sp.]|nr:hypothetical protein [Treponema sp.]
GFEDVVPANIDEVVGFVKMDGGHGLLLFKVYMMGRVEEKGTGGCLTCCPSTGSGCIRHI